MIKKPLMAVALTATAISLETPNKAFAVNLVTYDFDTTGFDNGSEVTGSLTLDLDALADAPNVTLSEFNSLADYEFTVSSSTNLFNTFILTDENSIWAIPVGTIAINATETQLTFNASSSDGFIEVLLNSRATFPDQDTLLFFDFGNSTYSIGNATQRSIIDNKSIGDVSPAFVFPVEVSDNPDTGVVPEPLTILGAGTAIAFGTSFKRKLSGKKKES